MDACGTIIVHGKPLGATRVVPPLRPVCERDGELVGAHRRYGHVLRRVPYGDTFASDDDDDAETPPRARQMREYIRRVMALREAESRMQRVIRRSDRTDLHAAEKQISIARSSVSNAEDAMAAVVCNFERDPRLHRALQTLRKSWHRFPAQTRAQLAAVNTPLPPYRQCLKDNVARVYPGWYAPSDRIRSVADIERILNFIRARHDEHWWRKAELVTVPMAACAEPGAVALQNLPAFHYARAVLLARWIENVAPLAREVDAAARRLKLAPPHALILRKVGMARRRGQGLRRARNGTPKLD